MELNLSMKIFLPCLSATLTLLLFGCASTDEQCIDINKIGEYQLTELIIAQVDKIHYEEEHFHRRTGEPEDYEIIDLNPENAPSE